jgi:hypothetical protein
LADEAVASARKRLYVAGFVRRFTQRVPQPLHGRVDAVVELDYGVVGPELVADLLAQNYLAGAFKEHPEDLKGLVLKPDADTVFAQLSRTDIQLKWAESDIRSRASARAGFGSRLHVRILF